MICFNPAQKTNHLEFQWPPRKALIYDLIDSLNCPSHPEKMSENHVFAFDYRMFQKSPKFAEDESVEDYSSDHILMHFII